MFDNLRQRSADEAEFLNPEVADEVGEPAQVTLVRRVRAQPGRILGLSPVQRFMLALMLFLNVSVLGCFALLVTEKIALPLF